ncbi:Coiled-coil domain-containing protein [Helicobacter cetorum]|uniref:Coiled-coil domain-containing protein n=1 Tax=Helicobacter cetorum TaxID=138563 RepID=UPI000CF080B0|nr:Coiled-coil domain-containing protein [Helicobacter cetorum]
MDTKDKEIELETLKREIAQSEASLENDFANYMAEHTDEKLEDLFFNNKVDFYKYILTAQNNYLKEHVLDKADKALALSDEIESSKKQSEIKRAQSEFLEKHKDENIDMNELVRFYNEELSPKYQREIDKLEGIDFFEAIYQFLKATKQQEEGVAKEEEEIAKEEEEIAKEEEKELPKEVQGNGVSGVNSASNQNVMTRF